MELDIIKLKETVRGGYNLQKLQSLYYLEPSLKEDEILLEIISIDDSLKDELGYEKFIEEASTKDLIDTLYELDYKILETLQRLFSNYLDEFHVNIQVYLFKKKSGKKTTPYKSWLDKKLEILVEHEYVNLIQYVSILAVKNGIHLELTY